MNPEKLDKLITAAGDLKPFPAAVDSPRMMMAKSIHAEEADDETYALPADKGVVAEVIPDDHLPADQEGNKAELLIPERRLSGLGADFDPDIFYGFPSHAVIPVHAKPKTRINRQRQGYSRRKAKRAYQARAAHQVKLTRYKRRGHGYLLLLDENGNPVNLKSDVHIAQALGRLDRCEQKLDVSIADAGNYLHMPKPSPVGRTDING